MLYTRDSREFKCVQGICRLLGRPCDHSQRSGLLQTSKPPEKAADGNVPHVRRLQRFQNPYDDDARAHGTQVWSYGRTLEQPFCAQKSASSVLFRSGHSDKEWRGCYEAGPRIREENRRSRQVPTSLDI